MSASTPSQSNYKGSVFDWEEEREREIALQVAAHVHKSRLNRQPAALDDWNADTKSAKKVALISHLFPTTWNPLLSALAKNGVRTMWVGMHDVDYFSGYGVMENNKIKVDDIFIGDFFATILTACKLKDTKILLSGECFYGANWKFENACVMYLILDAVGFLIRKAAPKSSEFGYIMYDGIKPVDSRVPGGRDLVEPSIMSLLYASYLSHGSFYIFNSNSEILTDYLIRTRIIGKDRHINFYRYGVSPLRPVERLPLKDDSIHMVCITLALPEQEEPSRSEVAQYVRKIVESGIYFHYYSDITHPAVTKFKESLSKVGKEHFIPHKIIKDPYELSYEIGKYHIGFNPSDHKPFARAIMSVNCRFYQDAMLAFFQSTFGTSFLVYAAAGLPFILPRGCVSATEALQPYAIPMSYAEYGYIPDYVRSDEFKEKLEQCRVDERLDCEVQTPRLINFLWDQKRGE